MGGSAVRERGGGLGALKRKGDLDRWSSCHDGSKFGEVAVFTSKSWLAVFLGHIAVGLQRLLWHFLNAERKGKGVEGVPGHARMKCLYRPTTINN